MNEFLLSIVIPAYNEENLIYNNIIEIKKILDFNHYQYEFVIIDDGSHDDTWKEIIKLSDQIKSLRALKLSKNFGKEAALCAGLDAAIGEAIVIMDADLQHPAEVIPQMVKLWQDEGIQVVDGIKVKRGKENFFSRITAGIFYKLLHKTSGIDLKNQSDFKLMDKKVVEAWRKLPEKSTFFRGMSFWLGFTRKSIYFEVGERADGGSKWSFLTLLNLATTASTSFSAMPLQIVTFLGFMFLIGSLVLGVQTLYMKFYGIAVSGFTTVILLILITGSGIMISLGIIGIYISRIYEEVKARPRYIVETEIEKDKKLEKYL